MQKRLTAKLFHAVVVLGVGMTSGCSDDSTPTPPKTPAGTSTSSSTSGGNGTSGALAEAGATSSSSSSTSGDAIPGWVCCG